MVGSPRGTKKLEWTEVQSTRKASHNRMTQDLLTVDAQAQFGRKQQELLVSPKSENPTKWILVLIQPLEKGIRREYSVARTPQQNGAEAVRTACLCTITNESACTQGELNAGTSTQKEEISQDCILMSIWKDASYFDSLANDMLINGEPKSAADDQKQGGSNAGKKIFEFKSPTGLDTWDLPIGKGPMEQNVAYTDSDYAGETQDRKSTTRGYQFLGNRLISWQCKKQNVVATSITEAEYVPALIYLLTKGFDAGSHIYYALTASPTIYTSLIEQFWKTTTLCTIDDRVLDTEAFLLTLLAEIFKQLALIEFLEKDLQQTKKTYSTALTRLILRVKKLERIVKTSKARRKARVVLSEDEDAAKDSSKQGRKISDIDTDLTISLE
ncbi:putative ribonuclease H-like domain-containing protein [Tanacetum coccineum]